MNKASLVKARIEDSLRISVLLKTAYIETYADSGITFELSNFIENKFTKEHIENLIKDDKIELVLACYNTNPVGIVEIVYDSICPIKNKSIAKLGKMYVLNRFIRKGIGYNLMTEVENILLKKGYKELNLQVYIENKNAISFYEKMGFIKLGKVDFTMEGNTYKNWVMNKRVN